MKKIILFLVFFSSCSTTIFAQIIEHLYYWQPQNKDSVFLRQGYVVSYNTAYRIPNWVAYHVKKDYLNTPQRKSRFSSFRVDKGVANPVRDDEYKGLHATMGYARGHLAPFAIMGGDRDKDGLYANYDKNKTDIDDEKTVFEANYFSNIAPQHQKAINGAGGLWFSLERWVQDDLVKKNDKEVWLIAGCIVIDSRLPEKVGKDSSIVVPDMFYKIVILEEVINVDDIEEEVNIRALAFLFPHYKTKTDINDNDIFKYLVPIDYIEVLTGLDFFNDLSEEEQETLESKVDKMAWEKYLKDE